MSGVAVFNEQLVPMCRIHMVHLKVWVYFVMLITLYCFSLYQCCGPLMSELHFANRHMVEFVTAPRLVIPRLDSP